MEYHEAGIHQSHVCSRNGADVIYSLVLCSVGIDVASERNTVTLQCLDDSFVREVLGSLECHVLQEVGETVLVIVLQNCTDVLDDVETGPVFRFLIMSYIIGQPVG